jgi:hypothetical protein
MDEQLQRLLQTPAMQQAMARAKTLAENNQRPFTFEVPGHDVMAGLGNRAATAAAKQITGQGLQDLKMASTRCWPTRLRLRRRRGRRPERACAGSS